MKELKLKNILMLTLAGCINAFGSGVTKIPAKGGYSKVDKTAIYFILDRFQISKMKDIVHTIDGSAFITITEVADVFKANI